MGWRATSRPRTRTTRIGFNVAWDVNDRFGLEFDAHSSSAEIGRGQPVRLERACSARPAFIRGTTTVDFSQRFPGAERALPPVRRRIDAVDDAGDRLESSATAT